MKVLNFIHSLPLRRQRSINRWFMISVGCTFGVSMLIVVIQAQQLYTLVNVRAENVRLQPQGAHYAMVMQRKQKLEGKLSEAQKQRTTIVQHQKQLDSTLAILDIVQAELMGAFKINSFKLMGDKLVFLVECKTPDDGVQLVKSLKNNSVIGNVKLTSLKSVHNNTAAKGAVVCVIEGVLKKVV